MVDLFQILNHIVSSINEETASYTVPLVYWIEGGKLILLCAILEE